MIGYSREDEDSYKNKAIIAAKDLHYGDEVVKKIKAATNDAEIARIMNTARHERR